MVPPEFIPFFAASAGAGAALIGLLFVAITVAPERLIRRSAPVERREVAASAFTALVNAFFISFLALVPGSGFFGVIIMLSSLALVNSALMAWRLLRQRAAWLMLARRALLVVAGLIVYGFELSNGIALLHNPHDINAVYAMTYLLGAVYGIGLTRAWQLLGARPSGISGWLSILNEGEELEAEDAAPSGAPSGRSAVSVAATTAAESSASRGQARTTTGA